MSALRRVYFALFMFIGVLGAGPAMAQVMHDDGIALPWFHSRTTQMARDACENDLPECRDSVRRELATEKAITRTVPWVLICLAIWGAVRYARAREKVRERQREEAARHHVRASVRTKDARLDERPPVSDDDVEDGLGFGHPGDKRNRPGQ